MKEWSAEGVIGHKGEEMTKCPRIYNVELHKLYFSSNIWEHQNYSKIQSY